MKTPGFSHKSSILTMLLKRCLCQAVFNSAASDTFAQLSEQTFENFFCPKIYGKEEFSVNCGGGREEFFFSKRLREYSHKKRFLVVWVPPPPRPYWFIFFSSTFSFLLSGQGDFNQCTPPWFYTEGELEENTFLCRMYTEVPREPSINYAVLFFL